MTQASDDKVRTVRMLVGRAYVAVALALSITLAVFAFFVAWQLAVAHLFVAGALAWAYLRPLDKEALEAALRTSQEPA